MWSQSAWWLSSTSWVIDQQSINNQPIPPTLWGRKRSGLRAQGSRPVGDRQHELPPHLDAGVGGACGPCGDWSWEPARTTARRLCPRPAPPRVPACSKPEPSDCFPGSRDSCWQISSPSGFGKPSQLAFMSEVREVLHGGWDPLTWAAWLTLGAPPRQRKPCHAWRGVRSLGPQVLASPPKAHRPTIPGALSAPAWEPSAHLSGNPQHTCPGSPQRTCPGRAPAARPRPRSSAAATVAHGSAFSL